MERTQRPTIGVVGLGNIGGNVAARLLATGYDVYGSARREQSARGLVSDGLRWRDTPREVAAAADVLLTSLPDDAVVDAVAGGPSGILAGLRPGSIWAEMSTISPRTSRALAARVRMSGAAMLDAPVSGSVPQAQAGTLRIVVGGDPAVYDRVAPVLEELGSPTRIGDNGHGLVLKLAINVSLAVQMLAFSEGVLLAEREGVDRAVAVDVMAHSAIGSPMLEARAPLVVDPPEHAWFAMRLMHKDIRLALATARGLGVPLPSAAVAEEVLAKAGDLGYDGRDIAAMVEVLAHDEPRAAPGARGAGGDAAPRAA
jgi:3-hydroxyisobutyrate dehydrogenase-like beta-hydroxyacid dehydrogenase